MIDKSEILDLYMKEKNILYVTKDNRGNITFPTDKEQLKLYKEIIKSNISNKKGQFYHRKNKTWYQLITKNIIDKETNNEVTIEFLEDITKLKKEERKLKIDALTSLLNDRNELTKLMNDYLIYAIENNEEFTVFMCDLDDFKMINDKYGHDCGDEVLKSVGKMLLSETRQSEDEFDDRKNDIVTRFGGDEFLLLLKDINLSSTKKKVEKLNDAVENMSIDYNGINISINMSFGYCHVDNLKKYDECNLDSFRKSIIKIADTYLYEAKNNRKAKKIYKKLLNNN